MSKVLVDVSMSLDGFIAGPNDKIEPLHDWLTTGVTEQSATILDENLQNTGAVIMGRRTFNLINTAEGWLLPDGTVIATPVFVLTHDRQVKAASDRTPFVFIHEGIEQALLQARAAAGDNNISLMGASIAQQFLKLGLVDEVQLHIVPVILGRGVQLFDQDAPQPVSLQTTRVLETAGVTHIKLEIIKE